jgi:hypothetical protein
MDKIRVHIIFLGDPSVGIPMDVYGMEIPKFSVEDPTDRELVRGLINKLYQAIDEERFCTVSFDDEPDE